MLNLDNDIKFYFKQNCKQFKDVKSYNVIGEIKGSKFPDKYLLVVAFDSGISVMVHTMMVLE